MAMCMGPAGIITERRHASCRLPGVLLAGLILGTGPSVFGQDSLRTELSGYAEVYFGYDLGGPVDNERPDFLYNHKRHNEVAINLAYIKARLHQGRVRANVALMAGTYAQYNLAAEPGALQHVMEANVGVKLGGGEEWWVDAGIMPSHIGFESAAGDDCWSLTRSLWAENTPYYEVGARLAYKPSERAAFSVLYLNGWQRIQRQAGNSAPAFGTQLDLTTANGARFNWSTFIGRDTPDSVGLWRFYNNVYTIFDGDTTGLTLGFDLGLQQRKGGGLDGWFGPVVLVRQRLAEASWAVGRVEFFNDEAMVIMGTDRPVMSASLGWDRQVAAGIRFRVEGRWIGNERTIFTDGDGDAARDNWAFTTALCARF